MMFNKIKRFIILPIPLLLALQGCVKYEYKIKRDFVKEIKEEKIINEEPAILEEIKTTDLRPDEKRQLVEIHIERNVYNALKIEKEIVNKKEYLITISRHKDEMKSANDALSLVGFTSGFGVMGLGIGSLFITDKYDPAFKRIGPPVIGIIGGVAIFIIVAACHNNPKCYGKELGYLYVDSELRREYEDSPPQKIEEIIKKEAISKGWDRSYVVGHEEKIYHINRDSVEIPISPDVCAFSKEGLYKTKTAQNLIYLGLKKKLDQVIDDAVPQEKKIEIKIIKDNESKTKYIDLSCYNLPSSKEILK